MAQFNPDTPDQDSDNTQDGDLIVRISGVDMPDHDDPDVQHDALNDLCGAVTSALGFALEDDRRFEGAEAVAEVPHVPDDQQHEEDVDE